VEDTTGGQAGPCDALITGRPGCILGILTADCVPLLLIDPKRRLAAAVHAGWRGTLLGVACRTVQRLVEELGSRPEDLLATIGPSIGPCCYSVGEEVIQALRADWPEFEGAAVRRSKSLCHLDLRALNRLQLLQSGLAPANLHVLGDCTACRTDLYFSHRAESGLTGRQLSLVGWKE
jgi:YfiH family protein